MSKHAHQVTIRNVPPQVGKALRKKAAALSRSLNSVLLEALETAAGLGSAPAEQHDLDRYAGTWVDDPKVDRALAGQRRVDPRDWA